MPCSTNDPENASENWTALLEGNTVRRRDRLRRGVGSVEVEQDLDR